MKALLLRKAGQLDPVSCPKPRVGRDDVLLKVSLCGICKTDAKMWRQGHRDLVLPRILGHEIIGVLDGTTETCAVWPGKACGRCRFCRQGNENLCSRMQVLGFHRDGGFAHYVAVHRKAIIPIPRELSPLAACFAEPLACCINAFACPGMGTGGRGLVYGGGTAGLLAALAAVSAGQTPFVLEPSCAKLEKSRSFRRKTGIAAGSTIRSGTFDWVINAAPYLETFTDGIARLQTGGSFCLFSGFIDTTRTLPAAVLNEVHYRQLTVAGAYGCTRAQMQQALEVLLQYGAAVHELIEDIITLEAVPGALHSMQSGDTFKYIIDLNSENR